MCNFTEEDSSEKRAVGRERFKSWDCEGWRCHTSRKYGQVPSAPHPPPHNNNSSKNSHTALSTHGGVNHSSSRMTDTSPGKNPTSSPTNSSGRMTDTSPHKNQKNSPTQSSSRMTGTSPHRKPTSSPTNSAGRRTDPPPQSKSQGPRRTVQCCRRSLRGPRRSLKGPRRRLVIRGTQRSNRLQLIVVFYHGKIES